MLDNLLKTIQGDDDGAQNGSSISSTAMETIKLVANQAIDLKSTVDEQNEIIRELINEIKKLKSEQKMLQGDLNLVHIDQKDLSKQLKILKTEAEKDEFIENRISDLYTQSNGQDISFDDIAEHFYPNYQNNKMIQSQAAPQAQAEPQNYRYERKYVTPEAMRPNSPQNHINKAEEILNHPAVKRSALNKKQQPSTESAEGHSFGRYPKFLR